MPYPVQLIELRHELLWPAEVRKVQGWSCLVKVLLRLWVGRHCEGARQRAGQRMRGKAFASPDGGLEKELGLLSEGATLYNPLHIWAATWLRSSGDILGWPCFMEF